MMIAENRKVTCHVKCEVKKLLSSLCCDRSIEAFSAESSLSVYCTTIGLQG